MPKTRPKEMLPIYDKPTIQYLIEKTIALRIDALPIITGNEVKNNLYKVTGITERFEKENPTNLAVIGRCILTPEIFDRIDETYACFGGEINLTDALLKLDTLYRAIFKGNLLYQQTGMAKHRICT